MMAESDVFGRIEAPTLASHVIDRIIASIQTGRFEIGDRLPPERKLAEMLGISRPTVRQALYALAVLGVLEIRQGSGTYVKTASVGEDLAIKAAELLTTDDSPMQALEARVIFEPQIAAAAAIHHEDADLREIERILGEMQRRLETRETFGQLDFDFHVAIARSLRNEYVEHTISLLLRTWFGPQSAWSEVLESIVSAPGRPEVYFEQHRAIYEGIRRGEAEVARSAMEAHLRQVSHDFSTL
jgi:GntR family transcriptional repressor for pyruvate dehydrogenase complex